jgi:hypothetical protein
MELRNGGIDIFYLDESGADGWHIITAVRVPFIRQNDGRWIIEWGNYLDLAKSWRKELSSKHSILFRKELHATKFLMCKDLYHKSGRNLDPVEAVAAYADAIEKVSFLPAASVMTVAAKDNSKLFTWKGIEAAFLALMQRLRSHCDDKAENRNGMLFFDEGHDEYVKLFRRACVYLPTGSSLGGTRNLPLSMFTEDGNFKKSHFSYFVQVADLVSYAALQKMRFESGVLNAKRVQREHHLLYDKLPASIVNLAVTRARKDGIVVL